MKRWCMLAVAYAGISGSLVLAAPLGDNTVRLSPSQLKLPQNIGPLRYSGENRFSDRRLGRSYAYNTTGISLSIYVYDYGVKGIPDGADSVPLCEQFESAKLEIENGGNYENVQLRSEVGRSLSEGPEAPRAREALYELDRHGVHAVSALWITAVDGYFVKLRLSLRSEVADELDQARIEILQAIARAIETRRRRDTRPVPEPLPEASIEVDSNFDPDTASLWFGYAAQLVSLSRQHPETRPPCGGRLVPGFAAELAARRAMLQQYRSFDASRRVNRYFDELLHINEAGFLDEYVWHYLRNERWDVTPPEDLDLRGFELFRERELGAHVVQSGARVRINTVRALPPAPGSP
jgi:hypothetical protein